MKITDGERAFFDAGVLTDGNAMEAAGVRIRKVSLGSTLQLQRIGNPYGRLGELEGKMEPGPDGEIPSMWEALGITDEQQIVRHIAEFIWLHGADPEEVRKGVNLPPERREEVVEEFMMRFSIADLPALEEAVFTGVLDVQAGMVNPGGSGKEDDDPLGRGRPGERP